MNCVPLVFEPRLVARPWGGRRLEQLLGKRLPDSGVYGESWELVSLPGIHSRVRDGVHAGRALPELVTEWGAALHGPVELPGGMFPLLVKFLDARENLSVQVHPRRRADATECPGAKDEAWYVVHAEPGAELFIGVRPGVSPADVAARAATPGLVDLLERWPVRAGDCFYLPSGVPHALGAGTVVAEVQTPSDVTYRLYDWGRVDAQGRPRMLHVAEALQNLRVDVSAAEIRAARPAERRADGPTQAPRVGGGYFTLTERWIEPGRARGLADGELAVWVVLEGGGRLDEAAGFRLGDVVVLPARGAREVEVTRLAHVLEVQIPRRPVPGR